MELSGKVFQVNPEINGQGRNGTWRKQEVILETQGNYPKKVCLTIWGDSIDQFKLKAGDQVNASIDIESREYNGRWYTDVKAWKIEKQGAETPGAKASSSSNQIPDVTTFDDNSSEDILPF
ncbi:DUF3127 domain-containing protein [Arthrospiribacter ruber]|uniref:DUF3127 domain-containing protein n=1 Tax=Arthrospiribacter ruber TaxID=2487934 RepID=A0A951MBY4_9BACT|nr:DUF3127 domain-containing protein [Arthrospiribacter ruber]MBW3467544.1 DUF3127 domain-containing protein [Arthrospiribacter ruber]